MSSPSDSPAHLLDALPLRVGLVELETFLTVAKLGGFSAAAAVLHISQPSVTHRVQRLERLMRTKLLNRTTKRVELSAAGRDLYEQAEATIHGLRKLIHQLTVESDRNRRWVSMAATPTLAAMVMPRLLVTLARQNPAMEVQVLDLRAEEILEALRNDDAELALIAEADTHPSLDFTPAAEVMMELIAPPGHPLLALDAPSLSDVMNYPILTLQVTTMLNVLQREFETRAKAFKPIRTCKNVSTLIGMVTAGLGVAFVPAYIGALDDHGGNFVPVTLPDLHIRRRYGIATLKNRRLKPAAEFLLRFLQRQFPVARALQNQDAAAPSHSQ